MAINRESDSSWQIPGGWTISELVDLAEVIGVTHQDAQDTVQLALIQAWRGKIPTGTSLARVVIDRASKVGDRPVRVLPSERGVSQWPVESVVDVVGTAEDNALLSHLKANLAGLNLDQRVTVVRSYGEGKGALEIGASLGKKPSKVAVDGTKIFYHLRASMNGNK